MITCPNCHQPSITWRARINLSPTKSLICPSCQSALGQSAGLSFLVCFIMLLLVSVGGEIVTGSVDDRGTRLAIKITWGVVVSCFMLWIYPRIVPLRKVQNNNNDANGKKPTE